MTRLFWSLSNIPIEKLHHQTAEPNLPFDPDCPHTTRTYRDGKTSCKRCGVVVQ